MEQWHRLPAMAALLMLWLPGCSSSSRTATSNDEFMRRGTLDIVFVYPDTTQASDQQILVQVDNGDTTATRNGSLVRDLTAGLHSLRCWDEDGSIYRFAVKLVSCKNTVFLPMTYRIRAPLPSFTNGKRKIEITKTTTVIFAVPTQ